MSYLNESYMQPFNDYQITRPKLSSLPKPHEIENIMDNLYKPRPTREPFKPPTPPPQIKEGLTASGNDGLVLTLSKDDIIIIMFVLLIILTILNISTARTVNKLAKKLNTTTTPDQ